MKSPAILRIALTTIGSRGDIQPYIALGLALKKSGHSVTILTHPWAEKIINSYELPYLPIGDDIDINYAAKQFVEKSSGNLKGLKHALNFIFETLRKCHADILSNLKDFDLVIGHGIVGSSEADMLDKPFVSVSIETMGLQKEYWKSGNIIRESGIFLFDKIMGAIFGKPYRKFRKEIGAPPIGSTNKYPYLALVQVSGLLQKPDIHWKKVTEITGFFLVGTPDNFKPDKDLLDFIGNGEKPILITFGSMFHRQEQTIRLHKIIRDAVSQSQSRAILLMPDLNIEEVTLPDNIFFTSQVPYNWLLKQVTLAIHHFGFGTTAEVLKAGLPSIPIPHIFDQKIRAAKVYKLGYAIKPLDLKTLNSDKLSKAILKAKADKQLQLKCEEAGIKISGENGTAKAVALINKYFDHTTSTTSDAQ